MSNVMNLDIKNKRDYNDKVKFGKSYWDQAEALAVLEKAEKLELVKRMMKEIVLNSDIRKIEYDIQGSGDSGSIEDTTMYTYEKDSDGNNIVEIEPQYEYTTIQLPTEHHPGQKCVIKPYTVSWKRHDADAKYTYPEAVEDLTYYITTGKVLSAKQQTGINGELDSTDYFVCREHTDSQPRQWPKWGEKLIWQNEFPKIGNVLDWNRAASSDRAIHPFIGLQNYVYQILPAGWEINEGSSSTVVFEYDDAETDNGDVCKNTYDDNNFTIDIEFNQVVYDTNEYSWKIKAGEDMYKVVSNYCKNNKVKDRTLNLNSEVQNSKFYGLVKTVEEAMEGVE